VQTKSTQKSILKLSSAEADDLGLTSRRISKYSSIINDLAEVYTNTMELRQNIQASITTGLGTYFKGSYGQFAIYAGENDYSNLQRNATLKGTGTASQIAGLTKLEKKYALTKDEGRAGKTLIQNQPWQNGIYYNPHIGINPYYDGDSDSTHPKYMFYEYSYRQGKVNFGVTTDGTLYSIKGQIGGWTIEDRRLVAYVRTSEDATVGNISEVVRLMELNALDGKIIIGNLGFIDELGLDFEDVDNTTGEEIIPSPSS